MDPWLEASMILGFECIGEPARAYALGSVAVCVCGNTDVKEHDRCRSVMDSYAGKCRESAVEEGEGVG